MKIAFDPNVRVEGNQTYVGFEDVQGDPSHLSIGQKITVFESESKAETSGIITQIDSENRLIYLWVDWKNLYVPVDFQRNNTEEVRVNKIRILADTWKIYTDDVRHTASEVIKELLDLYDKAITQLRIYEPMYATAFAEAWDAGPETAIAFLLEEGYQIHRKTNNGYILHHPNLNDNLPATHIFIPAERKTDYEILKRSALEDYAGRT